MVILNFKFSKIVTIVKKQGENNKEKRIAIQKIKVIKRQCYYLFQSLTAPWKRTTNDRQHTVTDIYSFKVCVNKLDIYTRLKILLENQL